MQLLSYTFPTLKMYSPVACRSTAMAQPLAVSYKEIMTHLSGLSRLASSVK